MTGWESIITTITTFAKREIVLMNNLRQFFVRQLTYKVYIINIKLIVLPIEICWILFMFPFVFA